uniref:Uncharacterized protein n=1 Tax=Xiphophorus couchianus TaxID=32473 RepID=A0A3B5MVS9_9TELE
IILSLGQLLSFLIKLALEKQELEWEKVQLTGILPYCALVFIAVFDTHNNNITFQGKYQVSAELKDKEINNLKEELKSLQVLRSSAFSLFFFLCFPSRRKSLYFFFSPFIYK